MKKASIILVVWYVLLFTFIPLQAQNEIRYEIYYDSHTTKTYPLKRKVNEIYNELIDGVCEESYVLFVIRNKERFAYRKDLCVKWDQDCLKLYQGDAKGDHIYGTLCKKQVCFEEVKPRSFLMDLLKHKK